MKGVVFTEFLQLVEEKFGYEVVDQILQAASPENDGAYTSVGTYDYQELIGMVVALSQQTGVEVSDLVKTFGRFLFGRFVDGYSEQVCGYTNTFELLAHVEDYIHVEVRKLYPSAELPKFEYCRPDDETLEMTYRSSRPFADLCEGLIEECVSHFGENICVRRDNLSDDGTAARFTLQRQPVPVQS